MRRLFAGAVAAVLATYLIITATSASAADTLLSQGKPATASSVESAAFPASNAVDGNLGTRWSSAFSDPQWLQVDLGASATITSIVLDWESAYARSFSVKASANAQSWTTLYSTAAGTGGKQTVNVNGTARYVRLETGARATQWGVSLNEFQVYGTGGGTTPTIPPGAVRVAEFLADCPFSHRLPDDPIIFPNLPGASHMHSFFGAAGTNAYSTVDTLLNANSNCNPSIDKSSYWIPTLYRDNVPVEPVTGIFYYLGEGVRDDLIAQTQPLPLGLRIVAGNAKATGPADNTISRWSCLHAGHVGSSPDFVNCPAGSMLESYLDFPHCWDGRNLDSTDHKSHMAYPVNNACPASHPVVVPKLRQVMRYPVTGDPARLRLASGGGFTMHGDFFNAWPVEEMARRVNDCIRPIIKCGTDGRP
ncbi:hypothetical protein FHR83_003236 [Actinoplanes campanulatus]|uniref:F5/8 type C domain-containing protein n=1 Tax=Actinoplanes campanulatus TaxID=113559 RepID=A0A7W5AFV9_9ACTN|nr:DUF1996 domain-containing protein [Actinoplanes campanulatus]MBB3095566.1 hypothetical protein [Actinoplanes campanulatus]GGN09898.1 hypothetical protein GCM10010109_19410 [Actinoplanes campanulatus]GID36459.1 hypothetical protein Aca09nite_29650 [Actinoplanes campanulatus]